MSGKRHEGPFYDAFGARIRTAMARIEVTGDQLAERLGVNASTISRWRAGTIPEPAILPRLAAALRMSLDELFGGRPTAATQTRPVVPAEAGEGPPSIVRARLGMLSSNEVMFLRLDSPHRKGGKKAPVLTEASTIMVDEVLNSGDTHVIVGRITNPRHVPQQPETEATGAAAPAPLGRQHTGRARGFRRQPALGDLLFSEERDGAGASHREVD